MKNLLCLIAAVFCTMQLSAQSFVSPIDFVENETNKARVISFIEKQVKDDYSAIGMDDPSTLRMMEKENLKAFKKLTEATNITLLRRVIKTYCEIGMCNYSTIQMMYEEEQKADSESLKW